MRSFIGIDLDPTWLAALGKVRTVFDEADGVAARGRWVPPENLHITLRFFGDLEAESLAGLAGELTSLCRATPPFDLPLLDPVFPVRSAGRATMLWASFDDPGGRCASFVRDITDTAAAFGVPPENREYVPHVTLVRFGRATNVDDRARSLASSAVKALLAAPEPVVSVPAATLFTSRLTRAGAVYTRHERMVLDGR